MRLLAWAMAVLIGSALAAGTAKAAEEKTPAGQKLFLDYKCNSCHTVSALKIEKRKQSGDEEEEAEATAQKTTKKKEPPDLSGAGLERKAAWIEGWLLKKELIDGKKHRKKFRGTAEEAKTVSAWLATLKTKDEAEGEKKGEGKGEMKKEEAKSEKKEG